MGTENIKSMKVIRNRKTLESREYLGKRVRIDFKDDDKIVLRRVISEGKHLVDFVAPWDSVYRLGTYEDETAAKEGYEGFDERLRNGYSIIITSGDTAIIRE